MSNFSVTKAPNGLKMVSFSDTKSDAVFEDIKAFLDSMPIDSFGSRTVALDKVSVNAAGTLSISDGTDLILSETAFNSLMNYLSIPAKFISRTPRELTITIINRFLSDSLVSCDFSIGEGIISKIGKSATLSSIPGCKTIFQAIVEDNPELSFSFGIKEAGLVMGIFSIGDTESQDSKPIPAIEVAYTEDMSSYPSISGMMLTEKGHATFPHLKFSLNPKDVGNGDTLNSIKSAVFDIKENVQKDVTKAHVAMGDAQTKEVWKAILADVHNTFDKSETKLFIKDEGRTIEKIFDRVREVKSGKTFSLKDRREHALCLGQTFSNIF